MLELLAPGFFRVDTLTRLSTIFVSVTDGNVRQLGMRTMFSQIK